MENNTAPISKLYRITAEEDCWVHNPALIPKGATVYMVMIPNTFEIVGKHEIREVENEDAGCIALFEGLE